MTDMDSGAPSGLRRGDDRPPAAALSARTAAIPPLPAAPAAQPAPREVPLATMMRAKVADNLLRLLRRRPARDNATVTVDRLLATALDTLREQGLAGFSVEAVAARAHMTNPTAYRYIGSSEVLVRAALRWWQGKNALAFTQFLDSVTFASEAEAAIKLVDCIVGRFPDPRRFARRLAQTLARDYHELDYQQMTVWAKALRVAFRRNGLAEAHLSDAQMLAAIACLAGTIKAQFIEAPEVLQDRRYRAALAAMFVGALHR